MGGQGAGAVGCPDLPLRPEVAALSERPRARLHALEVGGSAAWEAALERRGGSKGCFRLHVLYAQE